MKRNVLSIILVLLSSMFIGSCYYMFVPKVFYSIGVEYKNANIFFQDINNRDFIYMLNPFIVSISTFLLWMFSINNILGKFNNKLKEIFIF